MEYEQSVNTYVCRFCKGSFDQLQNLHKHVQQIHTARSSSKGNRTCPLCGIQCLKYEGYRNHLQHIHGHNDEGQVFTFKCFNDFLVWKNELEKRNYCKYNTRKAPNVLKSKDKIHLYQCDSSSPTSKEKKGGCAIKDSCPSQISAIESAKTHGIKVEYWNTHIGHIVPVEGDELDAAIGSLHTTEIVIDNQGYQDSEGNVFFLSESNDGSVSQQAPGKGVQKKPPSLFQVISSSPSSNQSSKPASRNFSYKKDPSKKSGSFSCSLASVACMKASAKKAPVNSEPSAQEPPVTSDAMPISMEASNSTSLPIAETIELPSKVFSPLTISNSPKSWTKESVDRATSSNVTSSSTQPSVTISSTKLQPKEIVSMSPVTTPDLTPVTTVNLPPSTTDNFAPVTTANSTIICGTSLNQPNLSDINVLNEGSLNGQFVLLNSLPGKNGEQNLILCPVGQNAFSIAQPALQEKEQKKSKSKQEPKNTRKGTQKNISTIQGTIISTGEKTTSEKENDLFSVQNVLSVDQKAVCSLGVAERTFLPSGPSILKKRKYPDTMSSAKKIPDLIKKKKKMETVKNLLSVGQKLSLQGVTTTSNQTLNGNAQNTLSPNIKGVITISSPLSTKVPKLPSTSIKKKSPSTNPALLNSISPGQTYMSINNNLIPIATPTGPFMTPNLNSGFILSSPVIPSQGIRPAQSLLNFSSLTSNPAPLVISNLESLTKTSGGTQPMILIPQTVNPFNSTMVGNTVSTISGASVSKSFISTLGASQFVTSPVSSKNTKSILSAQTLSNSKPIPVSSLPGNTQFISAPLLSNDGAFFSTQLISGTNSSQCIPSFVSTPFSTQGLKSIISTTVSNTIQVQKVNLPYTSSVVNPTIPSKGNVCFTSSVSEPTKTSTVVLNTEPISSTPAINISSIPVPHPQKPGSLIFESAGEFYVLEPVEDVSEEKPGTLDKNDKGKGKMPISRLDKNKIMPGEGDKEKTSVLAQNVCEEVKSSVEDLDVKLNEMFQNEKEIGSTANQSISEKIAAAAQSTETKVEEKSKAISPRRTSTFSNGVQIKSIVQEKRFLKDDDIEILKKVKYYQLEMKFLSSQAECKRLKLELARAELKNREAVRQNEIDNDLRNQDLPDKKLDVEKTTSVDEVSEDEFGNSDELEIDQASDSESDDEQTEDKMLNVNKGMDSKQEQIMDTVKLKDDQKPDNTSQEQGVDNKTEKQTIDIEVERDKAMDIEVEKDKAVDIEVGKEKVTQNETDYEIMDNNNIGEQVTFDEELGKEQKINNKFDKDQKHFEVLEEDQVEDLHILKEDQVQDLQEFEEDQVQDLQEFEEDQVQDLQEFEKDQVQDLQEFEEDQVKDIHMLEEDQVKDLHTLEEDQVKDLHTLEEDQVMDLHLLEEEQLMDINNLDDEPVTYIDKVDDVQITDVDDGQTFGCTELNEEQEILVQPIDKDRCVEESLKDLEVQYGDKSLDIYTMIRTSVLRSLYGDMKELCKENKKLFEELQNYRNNDKFYKINNEKTQGEEI